MSWTPFLTLWNWPTGPIKISWTPCILRDMEYLNPLPSCSHQQLSLSLSIKKTWKWTNYDTENKEFFFSRATFKTSDLLNSHWTGLLNSHWTGPLNLDFVVPKGSGKIQSDPLNFWVRATPGFQHLESACEHCEIHPGKQSEEDLLSGPSKNMEKQLILSTKK